MHKFDIGPPLVAGHGAMSKQRWSDGRVKLMVSNDECRLESQIGGWKVAKK